MKTNFALQQQLLTYGADTLKQAYVKILQQVTGTAVSIPKTLSTVVAFDVKNVKGSTITKFFTGSKLFSNLPDGYIRPQDKHQVVTAIKFFSANDATALGAATLVNGLEDGNVALNTGFLTIESNGVRYLDQVPLCYFTQVAEQSESGAYLLPMFIPWVGQTELVATVTFAAAPTATNNVYVGIALEGIGLQ